MSDDEVGVSRDLADSLSSTPISLSSENLDLDLEELDDTEYAIPPVDNPPTLESILNEPDDVESVSDEEISTSTGLFQESADTVSVASVSSLDSRGRRSDIRRVRRSPQNVHGCILRHVILKGVSLQIVSAIDRVSAGMPTAMAVCSMIAIGTAHGRILVFDAKQILKWCLGNADARAQFGSVTALSFNSDYSRLLCGYAKGAITMWDLSNGKLLRTILDSHPPGAAVLHIKFTDDPTLAVCSDIGGSVFELNFRRLIGVRSCESRCLFSGSRGEVLTIQPLQSTSMKGHPLQDMCLLAMATLSKVIVVSIRPKLKVLFTHALQAKPNSLPLITWQYVIIQTSAPSDRIIDPVFAFGRENVLYFFQVSMVEKSKIVTFIPLKKLQLNYSMLNFAWLNPRTIVILDTSEQLRMIDVRTQEMLEVVDLSDVRLVFGSSHFKGLSTGGNVSKAMALAGEQACYQSVASFSGQILLLGVKSVHLLTIRTWKERLDHLIKQHKYTEALELAQAFLEEKGKAVVGLSGKREEKMVAVAKEMWIILSLYLDYALTKGCVESSRSEMLEEYYREVIPTCIEYYIFLEHSFRPHRPPSLPNFITSLFTKVYDTFRGHIIARVIFLEALEPHILNGRFEDIAIPPTVVSDFVEHYASREAFEALQACIVHMEISTLDLHQVLTLCRTQGLYDAIFHIHNKAIHDYIGPLEELLAMLNESLQTGKQLSDNQINLGNKLLVYISCCLAGRAYPYGNIPRIQVFSIKEKVLKCLLARHSPNRRPDELLYPYLRILLHFDTREFLNVLSLAFEESEFDMNVGLWRRQDVVDILIDVMHHSQEFSPTQVGFLFTFLARQMAKHETTLIVNRSLFEQVVEYLTNTSDESRREERQQALLELHSAGGLKFYDEDRLLIQAEKAQFFQVCELLYMKRRAFNRLLGCYVQDPTRKMQVFSFTRNLMNMDDLTDSERNSIENEVAKNIEELLEIDNPQAAQLLYDCFPTIIPGLMNHFEKNPNIQYQFLKGLFEYQDVLDANSRNLSTQVSMDFQLVEKLIELMCQFDKHHVYKFIRNREDYRLDETLEIVKKFEVMDASAYLLEKLGRTSDAFKILIQNLDECILNLLNELVKGKDLNISSSNVIWCNVQATLVILIQFCQRNSNRMTENERELLWFQLLDTILIPQRKLDSKLVPEYFEASKKLTQHLMNNMMGYIKLPSILQKVLKDPSQNMSKFSEMRDLLSGMLATYNYEKTLLEATVSLLNNDLHRQLHNLCVTANRGYVTQNNSCNLCQQSYDKTTETDSPPVILFRCGHNYHASCLKTVEAMSADQQKEEIYACHLCQRRNPDRRETVRRISVRETNPQCNGTNRISRESVSINRNRVCLDQRQIKALDALRRLRRTGSRAAISSALPTTDTKPRTIYESSILHDPNFALRLAPPPIRR